VLDAFLKASRNASEIGRKVAKKTSILSNKRKNYHLLRACGVVLSSRPHSAQDASL
jgi:hypothetical protein